MQWTTITSSDVLPRQLPAWFSIRMIGERGSFGLLLANGDVMRITSITAVHQCDDGNLLLDVLLDAAGPPEGVDYAWKVKHYLGAPVPGATLATVNAAHVIAAVEFVAAEIAEKPGVVAIAGGIGENVELLGELPDIIARATG